MNAWTVVELDGVVQTLKVLVGARLQEVLTSEADVVLGFYTEQGLRWVWVDLDATRPCVLPWSDLPLRLRWKKTPLHLFLRAHFASRVLSDVYRDEHEGRVVHLAFGHAENQADLEVRLFPHGRNVQARAFAKSIAWQKPKPLNLESTEPARDPTSSIASSGERPARDLETLRSEWLARREGPRTKKQVSADPFHAIGIELERREKALAKVDEELARKRDQPWKQVGEWLKENQNLIVPAEWAVFVDKRRNLAWNIEETFRRARDLEAKLVGTVRRREKLVKDVADIARKLEGPPPPPRGCDPKPAAQPLRQAGAEGRTLRLENDIIAVQGKNATDNLKLLRKARAWDLWFHLRDSPSAHAIIFRNKAQAIGDSTLHRVAAWFMKNHLGDKLSHAKGERVEFLVCECRFVRPIKGDKAGRVNYANERTLTHRVGEDMNKI